MYICKKYWENIKNHKIYSNNLSIEFFHWINQYMWHWEKYIIVFFHLCITICYIIFYCLDMRKIKSFINIADYNHRKSRCSAAIDWLIDSTDSICLISFGAITVSAIKSWNGNSMINFYTSIFCSNSQFYELNYEVWRI